MYFNLFLKFRLFFNVLHSFVCYAFLKLPFNDDNIMTMEVAYMSDTSNLKEISRLVGIRIKHKRKEKNLTQEALSE